MPCRLILNTASFRVSLEQGMSRNAPNRTGESSSSEKSSSQRVRELIAYTSPAYLALRQSLCSFTCIAPSYLVNCSRRAKHPHPHLLRPSPWLPASFSDQLRKPFRHFITSLLPAQDLTSNLASHPQSPPAYGREYGRMRARPAQKKLRSEMRSTKQWLKRWSATKRSSYLVRKSRNTKERV